MSRPPKNEAELRHLHTTANRYKRERDDLRERMDKISNKMRIIEAYIDPPPGKTPPQHTNVLRALVRNVKPLVEWKGVPRFHLPEQRCVLCKEREAMCTCERTVTP